MASTSAARSASPAAAPSSAASSAAATPDPASRPDVCIVGLGLIGGSLLRATTAAGRTAWGWNRSAAAAEAAAADGYDVTTDLTDALRRAAEAHALVVIAVPLPAVDDVAAAIAAHAPQCPLTDVVSVKAPVARILQRHDLEARYVGGHPMAGTARSGWIAGSSTLFDGAVWVAAADDGADPQVWGQVAQLGLDCGAVVVPAESGEHDEAVARVSHLPHIFAEALAAAGAGSQLALSLAAGSFRDGTRVAGTDPLLVRAMCEGNSAALAAALDETIGRLTTARDALAAGETIDAFVGQGHIARKEYESVTRSTITGLAPGDPGWVEQLRDAGRAGGVWRGEIDPEALAAAGDGETAR